MDKEKIKDFKDDFTDDDKVDNKFWKPEKEGDFIIGLFKSIEEGRYGSQYLMDTKDGSLVCGSYAALKSKIDNSMLGKKIKIVYLGEKKAEKGGRFYKDFDVFTK